MKPYRQFAESQLSISFPDFRNAPNDTKAGKAAPKEMTPHMTSITMTLISMTSTQCIAVKLENISKIDIIH